MKAFRTMVNSVMCLCAAFRIQLYWQQGYNWQGRSFEFTKFCMMHSYRGFPGFGVCYHRNSMPTFCRWDAVYVARCNSDSRQQWTFVNLRNNQFQIKALSNGKCMERISNRQVRMRRCSSSNQRQRFFVPNGNNNNAKFAISNGSSNRCLSQSHHPKNGELISLEPCSRARKHETLYWEKE